MSHPWDELFQTWERGCRTAEEKTKQGWLHISYLIYLPTFLGGKAHSYYPLKASMFVMFTEKVQNIWLKIWPKKRFRSMHDHLHGHSSSIYKTEFISRIFQNWVISSNFCATREQGLVGVYDPQAWGLASNICTKDLANSLNHHERRNQIFKYSYLLILVKKAYEVLYQLFTQHQYSYSQCCFRYISWDAD